MSGRQNHAVETATPDLSGPTPGDSSSVRVETDATGTDYLVVPGVLFQSGVYSYPDGRGGTTREYLPKEELAESAPKWNGVAVTLGHPTANGEYTGVSDPESDTPVVGILQNVEADGDRLRGEAWIEQALRGNFGGDLEHAADAFERGNVVEISPGYVPELVTQTGVHDGRGYNAIQTNLTPDHFALLTGLTEEGNCSVSEGCGLGEPRANETITMSGMRANHTRAGECSCGGHDESDESDENDTRTNEEIQADLHKEIAALREEQAELRDLLTEREESDDADADDRQNTAQSDDDDKPVGNFLGVQSTVSAHDRSEPRVNTGYGGYNEWLEAQAAEKTGKETRANTGTDVGAGSLSEWEERTENVVTNADYFALEKPESIAERKARKEQEVREQLDEEDV
ncbi:DUF2213 domain-containing protein [Halopelagius fulvigenes]|uniref:DUF2213 domain-containing protein n=1 Tax=Halopelagius fulvigenes TaxID=1198324 RepID=A0ABD5TXD0_9EURY